MKKIFLFILPLFCIASVAQNSDKYQLTTQNWQIGIGSIDIKDHYLSPLSYSGTGLNFKESQQFFFNKKSDKLLAMSTVSLSYYNLYNPRVTAAMMYFDGNHDYAIHYLFRLNERIKLMVGGSWDVDLGLKYLSRNTNNPFNLDLSTNLNASVYFQWKIPTKRRVMQLESRIYSPLIGSMFVPSIGASYYEMSLESDRIVEAIHFSSLANKLAYKFNIAFEIPFKNWTFRVVADNERFQYKINSLVYHRYTAGISVGAKYDFYKFKGRRNIAPDNFISPND